MIQVQKEKRTNFKQNPYDYKRVNFLHTFRQMGFDFLPEEPKLLVEKIHSIDPNWIGNANYTAYGSCNRGRNNHYQQIDSTAVPCLEGEWIVVCYMKERKTTNEEGTFYGSEWHKYYLCQIDFSHKYLFKIIDEFEHIYDAFQYLADNQLVTFMESDKKSLRQTSVLVSNLTLSVLSPYETMPGAFYYDEIRQIFAEKAYKSEAFVRYFNENFRIPEENIDMKEFIYRKSRHFVPYNPFDTSSDIEERMTLKEYLDKVRQYKENYIWNI